MNVLTFDIEEWFNIIDVDASRSVSRWDSFESRIHKNLDIILSILNEKNQSGTFFCLGWLAKKYPDVIKKIDSLGYEIGSHSLHHQLVTGLDPCKFRADLTDSLHILEDIIGKKITLYRAPGFSIGNRNPWAFEILAEQGILTDSSVFPAKHGHGGYPEFGIAKPVLISAKGNIIKEFPINLAGFLGRQFVFSGGGYFRLFPYFLLKRLFSASEYCMSYFHPRDFDKGQPVMSGLPMHRRFKSYIGISGAFVKLKKLLSDFNFSDLRTADSRINWNLARVMKL
jgi:polysaccharide deacetylase family protein (PEP-CTERM system associated)